MANRINGAAAEGQFMVRQLQGWLEDRLKAHDAEQSQVDNAIIKSVRQYVDAIRDQLQAQLATTIAGGITLHCPPLATPEVRVNAPVTVETNNDALAAAIRQQALATEKLAEALDYQTQTLMQCFVVGFAELSAALARKAHRTVTISHSDGSSSTVTQG